MPVRHHHDPPAQVGDNRLQAAVSLDLSVMITDLSAAVKADHPPQPVAAEIRDLRENPRRKRVRHMQGPHPPDPLPGKDPPAPVCPVSKENPEPFFHIFQPGAPGGRRLRPLHLPGRHLFPAVPRPQVPPGKVSPPGASSAAEKQLCSIPAGSRIFSRTRVSHGFPAAADCDISRRRVHHIAVTEPV